MGSLSECVSELTELIQQNRTIEVIERFYADDVTMQENEQSPRLGKAICLDHERSLLAPVIDMTAKLLNQSINEQTGVVFSEWNMEAIYLSGQRFLLTEVSVQHWRNNQIYREKFYYDKVIRLDVASVS